MTHAKHDTHDKPDPTHPELRDHPSPRDNPDTGAHAHAKSKTAPKFARGDTVRIYEDGKPLEGSVRRVLEGDDADCYGIAIPTRAVRLKRHADEMTLVKKAEPEPGLKVQPMPADMRKGMEEHDAKTESKKHAPPST